MASGVRLRPQRLSCLRSWTEFGIPRLSNPFQIQVRGKKKKVKSQTIHVQLLENVPGYGRKGAILPIAPGRMRNKWYPQNMARYTSVAEVKSNQDLIVDRDSSFGMGGNSQIGEREESWVAPVQANVQLLSPQRSLQLLEALVPDRLEFYRTPILASETQTGQEAALITRAGAPTPPPSSTAIYGSVSTLDIIASIKELLLLRALEKANEDAARIVLNPEDIKIIRGEIVEAGVEADRIKILGDFEVEIQQRGDNSIRRKVRVSAQT